MSACNKVTVGHILYEYIVYSNVNTEDNGGNISRIVLFVLLMKSDMHFINDNVFKISEPTLFYIVLVLIK